MPIEDQKVWGTGAADGQNKIGINISVVIHPDCRHIISTFTFSASGSIELILG